MNYVYPEPRPWRIKSHPLLPGEMIVTVVDRLGMPVWWPNLFHVFELRDAGKSYATQKRTMSAIATAFNWAAERDIDLEARIESFEFLDYAETKALQARLQINTLEAKGGNDRIVGNGYWDSRCRAVRDYMRWRAAEAMHRLERQDAEHLGGLLHRAAGEGLNRFCEDLVSGIGPDTKFDAYGLDPDEQAALLFAITPGSPSNPFEERHQDRNFALILTIFELGARNGETLGLKRDDLHLGGSSPTLSIQRRQNDSDDVRRRPAKTKTRARMLPVSGSLATILNDWTTCQRSRNEVYPRANRSPYLFVSERGRPIDGSTVEKIFRMLREVEGIPPWLTAHKLRHTFNDRFSEMIDDLPDHVLRPAVEARMRNFLNGWSPTSQQGEHYRRRFVEAKGHDILLKLQDLSAQGASRS